MTTYVQDLETVDGFETYKEAKAMLKEYRFAEPEATYYLSQRPTNAWRDR